jgi:hypothetical protein
MSQFVTHSQLRFLFLPDLSKRCSAETFASEADGHSHFSLHSDIAASSSCHTDKALLIGIGVFFLNWASFE